MFIYIHTYIYIYIPIFWKKVLFQKKIVSYCCACVYVLKKYKKKIYPTDASSVYDYIIIACTHFLTDNYHHHHCSFSCLHVAKRTNKIIALCNSNNNLWC